MWCTQRHKNSLFSEIMTHVFCRNYFFYLPELLSYLHKTTHNKVCGLFWQTGWFGWSCTLSVYSALHQASSRGQHSLLFVWVATRATPLSFETRLCISAADIEPVSSCNARKASRWTCLILCLAYIMWMTWPTFGLLVRLQDELLNLPAILGHL